MPLLQQPDIAKQLFDLGAEPDCNTPDAYARLVAAEVEKWNKVVAATGVKAE